MDVTTLQYVISTSLSVVNEYKCLIDSYVLDFYVEDHWSNIKDSWKTVLFNPPTKTSDLLVNLLRGRVSSDETNVSALPLSLICLKQLLRQLESCRIPLPVQPQLPQQDQLQNYLFKHIKAKKRHEILRMTQTCAQSALECDTKYVVDFGAGLGHLARVLAFIHGLKVCCLERQEALSRDAKELDQKCEEILMKKSPNQSLELPCHLNCTLTNQTDYDLLLQMIRDAFRITSGEPFTFGIVGLHPCGDLSIILTKFFLKCPQAKFLTIAGCCYMKLTETCYPVSDFLKATSSQLSYEAKEIACHAIESYTDRLMDGNYEYLKIHCYRALLERILVKYDPKWRRMGLRSVKQRDGLTFAKYCQLALEGVNNVQIPEEDCADVNWQETLHNWPQVMAYYSMRLLFAPLIETIILYDRMLWILEQQLDCDVKLLPIFDPLISPRNQIMVVKKSIKS